MLVTNYSRDSSKDTAMERSRQPKEQGFLASKSLFRYIQGGKTPLMILLRKKKLQIATSHVTYCNAGYDDTLESKLL